MTTPSTAPRLNPADEYYQMQKRLAGTAQQPNPSPAAGSDVPTDPAGWWEEDPEYEGGYIYHAAPDEVLDPADLEIPYSSNFVPDPVHPGGAVVLQTL